ncbi:protein FAM200A-like [Procambarus clarkii]|uniref:protein FAM200A-like n=1 Tax=Procambarus clarkii TaxID=6728 RepID=UPI003743AC81
MLPKKDASSSHKKRPKWWNNMHIVFKTVNHICAHAKKHRMFRELCKDMEANFTKLLLHTEVRWLSRGKVLIQVFALREQLCVCFIEKASLMAFKCQDVLWLAILSYMASIFDHLNKLNISQQGKGGDIFTSIGKINVFKLKVKKWKSSVEKRCFSDFELFDSFMRECGWEHDMQTREQTLEVHMSHLVIRHLTLMQQNLDFYCLDSENDQLTSNMWMLNPFTDEGIDHCDAPLELRAGYSQKSSFQDI